ncbi:condensation domain-containing protein [Vibrio sp. PP-XX7]
MSGQLNVDVLQQALDRIVARHATLRTHIEADRHEPKQVIGAQTQGFPLTYLDGEGVMESLAPFAPVFDLTQGPLIQGQLIRVSGEEHLLRIAMHHIITDGWSLGILIQELSTLHTAFLQGQADPLPPLPIQYGDYAVWQQQYVQGERLQAQQQYWIDQLQGIPDCLSLPTDRPRPPRQDYSGANVPVHLGRELTDQLNALSRRHGCTLYMTLLASWSLLMSRLSRQDDIVIGSPVAGRTRTGGGRSDWDVC